MIPNGYALCLVVNDLCWFASTKFMHLIFRTPLTSVMNGNPMFAAIDGNCSIGAGLNFHGYRDMELTVVKWTDLA